MKAYYVAPVIEVISISEELMQAPLQGSPAEGNVRDEEQDEDIDADGSFGFAKKNNNFWEED